MRLGSSRLSTLLAHGLSESEARVYMALLDHATMPAATLAKVTGVPRSHLYNILEQMQAVGLVEILIEGKTRTYRARPFSAYLERNARALKQKLEEIEKEMAEGLAAFEPPALTERETGEAGAVRLLLGRQSVAREIDELLERASTQVAFLGSPAGVHRLSRHLTHLEGASEGRRLGFTLSLFLPPQADVENALARMRDLVHLEVHELAEPVEIMSLIVDGAISLIVQPTPDTPELRSGDDVAFVMTYAPFVRSHLSLLRQAARAKDGDVSAPQGGSGPA